MEHERRLGAENQMPPCRQARVGRPHSLVQGSLPGRIVIADNRSPGYEFDVGASPMEKRCQIQGRSSCTYHRDSVPRKLIDYMMGGAMGDQWRWQCRQQRRYVIKM